MYNVPTTVEAISIDGPDPRVEGGLSIVDNSVAGAGFSDGIIRVHSRLPPFSDGENVGLGFDSGQVNIWVVSVGTDVDEGLLVEGEYRVSFSAGNGPAYPDLIGTYRPPETILPVIDEVTLDGEVIEPGYDDPIIFDLLFGFTGDTLTQGALATNASRIDPADIASYIENARTAAGNIFDIDGNGITDALTDGILMIRYLFGLTGETLVTRAVAENCQRCTEQEIIAYFAAYMP